MKNALLLIAIFSTAISMAQAPSIQWQKCFGGTEWDNATCIRQTTDGGYIVAGDTSSTDGDAIGNDGITDVWVVKISASGALQWQKSFGGSWQDYCKSIQQTNDGGYIVAGYTQSNDGDVTNVHGDWLDPDAWVIKLSGTGDLVWQKALGGTNEDYAYDIQQTTDGGYIMAGYTKSNDYDVSGNHGFFDAWVVKLSGSGMLQWQKALGGTDADEAFSIQQTVDGGYIMAGLSYSADGDVLVNRGMSDVWVAKLSSSGAMEWQKTYGGSYNEEAHDIRQTDDGGYILAGMAFSVDGDVTGNHGTGDIWAVKISDTGTLQWQRAIGGTDYEQAQNIQQTTDGGYILTGDTTSTDADVSANHGNRDAWVVKLSDSGSLEWQKTLGGIHYEQAESIQQTADGGYIIACDAAYNNGDVSGCHAGGKNDFWIVKLEPELAMATFNDDRLQVFPNPAQSVLYLKAPRNLTIDTIMITDMSGKILLEENHADNGVDVTELACGMYVLKIKSEGKITTQKFIKE